MKVNGELHTSHTSPVVSRGGLPSCAGNVLAGAMATRVIDWPNTPPLCSSAGLVKWHIGFFFFLPVVAVASSIIVCISRGFSGLTRPPSCTLTLHLVLDDFEGQDMERGGHSCDKTLKVSEMVLVR